MRHDLYLDETSSLNAPDQARPWWQWLVLALACWGSAWAGVWLATWPMSYASSVWPAAGVGLAGLLLLGRSAWPAVWLGRAAFEWGFQAPSGALDLPGLLFAASAATAQAWAGAWLVARHVRLPTRLRHARKMFRLMGLGAVSGLVCASLQLPWLVARGRLDGAQLPEQWGTWVLGDVMGIALVLPLVLLWAIPGGWRMRRKWVVSVWTGLALAAGLAGSYLATRWEAEQLETLVRRQALEASRVLRTELDEVEHALRTLQLLPAPRADEETSRLLRRSGRSALVGLGTVPEGRDLAAWQALIDQAPDSVCGQLSAQALRQALQAQAPGSGEGMAVVALRPGDGPSCLAAALLTPQRDTQVVALVDVSQLAMRTLRAWAFNEALGASGLFNAPHGLVARLTHEAAGGQAALLFEHRYHPSPTNTVQAWAGSRPPPVERFDQMFGPQPLGLTVSGDANFWAQNATGLPALVFTGGMLISIVVLVFLLEVTGRSELMEAAIRRKTVELDQSLMLLEETAEGYQHQSEQFRMLLRSTPVGFLAFGADGRVLVANEALAEMLALSPEALRHADRAQITAQLQALCPQNALDAADLLHEAPTEGQTLRLSVGQDAPGAPEPRVLSAVRSLVLDDDVRCVYLFTDITEAARLERSKTLFISSVAHEVRTPLTSIIGYAELLLHRAGVPEDMRQRMLSDVVGKARDLKRLMAAMLDLAELETLSHDGLPRQTKPVADAVARAVITCQIPPGRQAPAVLAPEQPMPCHMNLSKLSLALRHLIENAYAFSGPETAVTVRLEQASGPDGQAVARISVSDQGIGIRADHLPQVFDRFFRVDTSGEKPGFGLGLSIVREIVALHHGQIQMRSTPGEGTVATLVLPLVADEPPPA